jgi:hypothetical protein
VSKLFRNVPSNYDVTADGKRFLMIKDETRGSCAKISP